MECANRTARENTRALLIAVAKAARDLSHLSQVQGALEPDETFAVLELQSIAEAVLQRMEGGK